MAEFDVALPGAKSEMPGVFCAAVGPFAVDQMIRQAIAACWMMLPQQQRTFEAVESNVRRVVDRALRDLQEDSAAFGTTRP
jgi:hypothetical protein